MDRDTLDFNKLRVTVAGGDESSCKDLRLCAIDVWQSVSFSNDSLDVKIKNINWLNELYLADKDTYDATTAEAMETVMELLAEFIVDDRKGELK